MKALSPFSSISAQEKKNKEKKGSARPRHVFLMVVCGAAAATAAGLSSEETAERSVLPADCGEIGALIFH